MKKTLLFILCLWVSFSAFAQKKPTKTFPQSWEGIWKGDLQIFNNQGLATTLPMEIHILPDSNNTWKWTIVYAPKDKPKDERPYTLRIIDAKKGHYVTDENNSIVLDAYYIGGTFWSWFEVEGTRLLVMEHLEGKNLIMEIVFSGDKPINVTGGKDADTPPASSFEVKGAHKAILKRVSK
jgi:hypothetical protein